MSERIIVGGIRLIANSNVQGTNLNIQKEEEDEDEEERRRVY